MLKRTSIKYCQEAFKKEILYIKERGHDILGLLYSEHKRHTIFKKLEDEGKSFIVTGRKNAYDYINDFIINVVPKVEDFIESRLLEKFKQNLQDEEKRLVEDAQKLRKHKISAHQEIKKNENFLIDDSENKQEVDFSQVVGTFNSFDGLGLTYHNYEHIGKYTLFNPTQAREIFPFNGYGEYQKEYNKTKMYSIMCREEGVRLTNAFSKLTLPHERVFDYQSILNGEFDFKSTVKTEEGFLKFFQEFSHSLVCYLEKSANHYYYRFLSNADVFEGLITVLVRTLQKNHINTFLAIPDTRDKIFHQILTLLQSKFTLRKEAFQTFEEIVEELKILEIYCNYSDLIDFADKMKIKINQKTLEHYKEKKKQYFCLHLTSFYEVCNYQWRPDTLRTLIKDFKGFNSGALLYGEAGTGKSQVMAYVHAWAKENNWIVIPIPRATRWTKDQGHIERHVNGLFIQHQFATEFLTDFKIINYEILKQIPVNHEWYGKFDIAGHREGDPDPVPAYWDEKRRVWSDSYKYTDPKTDEQRSVKDYGDHHKRIIDYVEKPKTMLDLVNAGLKYPRFSTCCLAEMMYQLYRWDNHKMMVLVDEYNEWFKPSEYLSYRYGNIKDGNVRIPPYDLSLVRMFMKFDGHLMKNGVKVFASSCKWYHNHKFEPSMINFPKKYEVHVDNLKLNDFRYACNYYMFTKYTKQFLSEGQVQYLYTLSQGNWKHFQYDLNKEMRFWPTFDDWIERKQLTKITRASMKAGGKGISA